MLSSRAPQTIPLRNTHDGFGEQDGDVLPGEDLGAHNEGRRTGSCRYKLTLFCRCEFYDMDRIGVCLTHGLQYNPLSQQRFGRRCAVVRLRRLHNLNALYYAQLAERSPSAPVKSERAAGGTTFWTRLCRGRKHLINETASL
jgi:hypothetical protein